MIKVGIVFGSPSDEHEVSLACGESVLKAFKELPSYEAMPIGIDKEGQWYTGENALPTLLSKANHDKMPGKDRDISHIKATAGKATPPTEYINECDYIMLFTPGKYGEDGRLQGFFQTMGASMIGCGVLSSSLCFDKAMLKATLSSYGYPVTPGVDVFLDRTNITQDLYNEITTELKTEKLVLKPTDNGSSIGIAQSRTFEEFKKGIIGAQQYTNHVVVERFIAHQEIAVGVIGQGDDLLLSALGDNNDVNAHLFSYDDKYVSSEPSTQANLDDETAEKIRKMTREIYALTKCSGWARIDFFIEKESNDIYVNEINTIPGMTQSSVFPQIFEMSGINFVQMIEHILNKGIPSEIRNAA